MSVLIDSACIDDLVRAEELGFVRGVTTNPSLMRQETDDPLRHAARILEVTSFADVYYQPTGACGSLLVEARKAWSLEQDRVVLKLPATRTGIALAGLMTREGARVALTAAQVPHSMIVAESIGCYAVIPYLDRALRDIRTDPHLLRSLAEVRRGDTKIIAASVKNCGQFLNAFHEGADAVTAPLHVLLEILGHPAPLEAEAGFAREYQDTVAPPHDGGATALDRIDS